MQVGRQGVMLAERRMAILTGRIVFVTLAVWTLVGGSGGGSRASADPSPSIVRYVVYSLPLTLGVGYYSTLAIGKCKSIRVERQPLRFTHCLRWPQWWPIAGSTSTGSGIL